ncbi:MAG: glycoside hydrolase/phage tail family protein [Hyphomicrobiaceae bacterium]|nr:glycoside hydrolase/phage tail family protein [Hyphomicrobiaceae bacterium]
MATLALAVAGAAAGSALLPAGVSVLGVTLSGAAIGAQVGSLAGAYVDAALFSASGEARTVEGPRLRNLHVTASTEGAPIPRLYGRARLGGQVIWATPFEEEVVRTTDEPSGGGKGGGGFGGGGNASAGSIERVEYRYHANFAIGLCEGEITGLGRVWADGNELDLSDVTYRVHLGGANQALDSLISAHQGPGMAPAYRGTAYVVFERLALAEFGNRIPQLSFEVYRAIEPFGEEVRAVVLIPGSGEFVYAPTPVSQVFGLGGSRSENVHTRLGGTDWAVALDQMQVALPNVENVSLIVSWFGTDLRVGACQVRPGVEVAAKDTTPFNWQAGGVGRSGAHVVSQRDGRPAYGGTPADRSVVAAIVDLKARGIAVTLTPFVLMDIAEGNGLPDPYGGLEQAPYPWRGRITCHPAPGEPGSPDKTASVAADVAAFVGTAEAGHFSIAGDVVNYSGPAEWSYRRMVLHLAHLAKAAGGVDAFLLGTELRGLTWLRDGTGSYPFVAALMDLAADVSGVLGPGTKVTYAADWTEYFGHQPQDGSGDVYFHLDPLWASPHVDAVGIDCYWPLADWRDGRGHLDYTAGARSIYDLDYLRGQVQGGEGYDWYYASAADRDAQVRTPITDGAGKPWIFRTKDVKNWWLNPHTNRPGGLEAGGTTAWVPQSKPIWLMEIGCPATDKGANQPNVFVDPKSSENALPYYSAGFRDDLMQRRYLKALIEAFDPASEGYVGGANPVSGIYGGRMLDTSRMFVYCWDARPFPAFPQSLDIWGDGENWRLGHWVNGRLGAGPLAETVAAILADYGFAEHAAGGLHGMVPGYVIDRPMSARDALQPLGLAYFFDAIETNGRIAFRHRGAEPPVVRLIEDDLVEEAADKPLLTLTRGQETELPASAKLTYVAAETDYEQAVAEARRLTGASGRLAQAEVPIVLETEQAGTIAESLLFEAWAARERGSFAVPPSLLAIEPGDVVEIERGGIVTPLRVTEISDRGARAIEARSVDPDVYGGSVGSIRTSRAIPTVTLGVPHVEFLDLPLLPGALSDTVGFVAATARPWPGSVAIYGSPEASGLRLRAVAAAPAIMGITLDPLPAGPVSRPDDATRIRVEVTGGALASISRLQLLAGGNSAAVRGAAGAWEVVQFERAELIAPNVYELSGFLRGQAGTETAMAPVGEAIAAGTAFVLLNGSLAQVRLGLDEIALPYIWRTGPGSRDVADASYAQRVHAFAGLGLRPLSPVHARARRSGGDVTLSWIRRTRTGGDGWEASEVPLGEDSERYVVDILDGEGAVLRTVEVTQPRLVYASAEQVADFGSPPASLTVRIAQMSDVYGRGVPLQADV